MLGLNNFKIIECSPDKPNIYLEKFKKEHASDVEEEYENIVNSLCDKLFVEKENFPVTLIYVPVYYMSRVIMYSNLATLTIIFTVLFVLVRISM